MGKGGAGKSALAGTFARLLARTGDRVLALDSDPMPGMAFSLGVERSDSGLPDEAVEQFEENGRRRFRFSGGLTGAEVAERYAVPAPDGVRFLQLGKARGVRWDNSRQHFGYQRVLDDLPDRTWSVVGDLPGGTRQAFFTWGRFADTYVVVAEPTPASMLTGRRLARLTDAAAPPRVVVVANKVRAPRDGERVAERTGLPLVGAVPFDPALATADRLGRPLLDHDGQAPSVEALRSLVETLRAEAGAG